MSSDKKVEGTKTFFYWALFCWVIGLWCLKDGWFPSSSVLEKHPDPADHFYSFNKSAAVILLSIAIICSFIHRVVR